MKRAIKIVIGVLVILAAVGGGIYTMTAPAVVPLSHITEKDVELSFSEQGTAVAENVVRVYPLTQGQVRSVNVRFGQSVSEGEVICELDSGPLILRIDEIRSMIKGYEAQYANLDADQERIRSDLQTSRSRLEAELDALAAQEKSSGISLSRQNSSVSEQLRLQDLLIEQSASDLARTKGEMEKAELLYLAGTITLSEYEAAQYLVEKAETALEVAELERGVIAGGRGTSSAEYFKSAKAVIDAQIKGIEKSLEADYTGAMKDYYTALMQGSEASIKQIERQIEDCVVTAPLSGNITQLNVISMNFVSAAAPVAEITVPGNTVEVFVSTQDVDSIKPGDTVEMTLKRREGDVVFTGEVKEIGSMAEVRISTLGVEEHKVKVKIEPDLSLLTDASFGIGFGVDVKFFVYSAEAKLAVPKTALFKDGGRDMLWVVRVHDDAEAVDSDPPGGEAANTAAGAANTNITAAIGAKNVGVVEAIEVTVGMELRTETVIETGLTEGDFVVTDANNKDLKNGLRVKVGDN